MKKIKRTAYSFPIITAVVSHLRYYAPSRTWSIQIQAGDQWKIARVNTDIAELILKLEGIEFEDPAP